MHLDLGTLCIFVSPSSLTDMLAVSMAAESHIWKHIDSIVSLSDEEMLLPNFTWCVILCAL